MTVGLRVLSVCVVASLFGATDSAYAQEAVTLHPTVSDAAAYDIPVIAPIPQLTIAPEEKQLQPQQPKQMANSYGVQGIGLGGIRLYPSLQLDSLSTSNVSESASEAQPALGVDLKPSLRFESDWVRHSWVGLATGDFTSYLKNQTYNSQQAEIDTKFRLDVRHTTFAEFEASYNLDQTGNVENEINTVNGIPPTHTLNASVAITQDFNPVAGRLKLGIERQIFDDTKLSAGGKLDNSDLDDYTPSASLRLSYREPPVLKPFVELIYAPTFRDQNQDRNGLNHESQGLTAGAGVTIDNSSIWSGEVALVYSVSTYKDPTLATIDVFGINGNLTWKPVDATTVLLTLLTALNETNSITSAASKTHFAGIDVTHAVRENLGLQAGLGFELDKGSGEANETITSSIGLEMQLNPGLTWTAGYDGTWFYGATSAGNYSEQRISTGIILRR